MPEFLSKFLRSKYSNPLLHVIEATANLVGSIAKRIANIDEYDQRFEEPWALYNEGIQAGQANAYPERFSPYDICRLHQEDISGEKVSGYPERFSALDIIDFAQISPQEVISYPDSYSARDISFFVSEGIPPAKVIEYNPESRDWDYDKMKTLGFTCAQMDSHRCPFTAGEIASFVKCEIPFEQAEKYSKVFTGYGLRTLVEGGVSPEIANEFIATYHMTEGFLLHWRRMFKSNGYSEENSFMPEEIVFLNRLGITPDKFDFHLGFIQLCHGIFHRYDINDKFDDFSVLGVGSRGVVIRNRNLKTAYKFSLDLENEVGLLHSLQDTHARTKFIYNLEKRLERDHISTILEDYIENGERKTRVLKPRNPWAGVDLMEVEYISGKSLQDLVSERLPSTKIITYARDVLLGLQEMRKAEIYHHRDLRPANVMIDEEKNRAVIIDLGIASRKKDALSQDNRRFGSASGRVANDLNSLGQVMYYIATGKKVFSKSKSMDRTTFADGYRDFRDSVYGDSRKLRYYCNKVRRNIENGDLAEIITFCLKSKGTDEDYQSLEELFIDSL